MPKKNIRFKLIIISGLLLFGAFSMTACQQKKSESRPTSESKTAEHSENDQNQKSTETTTTDKTSTETKKPRDLNRPESTEVKKSALIKPEKPTTTQPKNESQMTPSSPSTTDHVNPKENDDKSAAQPIITAYFAKQFSMIMTPAQAFKKRNGKNLNLFCLPRGADTNGIEKAHLTIIGNSQVLVHTESKDKSEGRETEVLSCPDLNDNFTDDELISWLDKKSPSIGIVSITSIHENMKVEHLKVNTSNSKPENSINTSVVISCYNNVTEAENSKDNGIKMIRPGLILIQRNTEAKPSGMLFYSESERKEKMVVYRCP